MEDRSNLAVESRGVLADHGKVFRLPRPRTLVVLPLLVLEPLEVLHGLGDRVHLLAELLALDELEQSVRPSLALRLCRSALRQSDDPRLLDAC